MTELAGVPGRHVVLVGCVSQKERIALPAKQLYRSALFQGRRSHAEASARPWFIVSARYGLVEPDQVIEPYDLRISQLSRAERDAWARQVAAELADRVGGLDGVTVELHTGDEYASALRPHLKQAGATMARPLQGLRLGEQIRWYAQSDVPTLVGDGRGLARRITALFCDGRMDLSARAAAPAAGWAGMPELAAAARIREHGASPVEVRLLLTFLAAMDRARDADRLWRDGTDLFLKVPWVFRPEQVAARSFGELLEVLAAHRVSQRHGTDGAAWRIIAELLSDPSQAPAVHAAVYDGSGDARVLLAELAAPTPRGPRVPLLSGPKIGPMWVRMLAVPGGAAISSLGELPVAVDVQVRKVSEYLGVVDTRGRPLEQVRGLIQRTWQADVRQHGTQGPPALAGTAAALDPALWFYGKWGCTACEVNGQRIPIAGLCRECQFDRLRSRSNAASGSSEVNQQGEWA
jgi:hypothetical protein